MEGGREEGEGKERKRTNSVKAGRARDEAEISEGLEQMPVRHLSHETDLDFL